MNYLLLLFGKLINNVFGYSKQDYRYYDSWKYIYRIGLHGIGRIQGNPIDKSGEIDVIKKMLRDPGESLVVMDVGSNKGDYSSHFLTEANALNKRIAIHIFEPSQTHFQSLHERFNIKKFPKHCFYINQLALSDSNSIEYLYTDYPGSDLGSLMNLRTPIRPFDDSKKEQVQTMMLDDYLDQHEIKQVDLLKIDVEGGEFKVLSGGVRSIEEGRIKNIQFEFGAGNITARIFFYDFWNLFSPRYRFFQVLAGGLVPITAYSTELEIFKTTNYLLTLI